MTQQAATPPAQEPAREGADPSLVSRVVAVLSGRWTIHVISVLNEHGRLRFTELRRLLPGIAPKVLTQRLRQLERDGLVTRSQLAESPPRVEYETTRLARSLTPVFAEILSWATRHLPEVEAAHRAFDRAR